MFHSQVFKTSVAVGLKNCKSIDDAIKKELQRIEGTCISSGYVKPGSVKILSRSIGTTHAINTSGNIYYDVVCSADIFNPHVGDVISCSVEKVNKLGVMAHGADDLPVCVIIARQHHEDTFRECKPSDVIDCEVIGSRFKIKDREIQVIAKMK
jgi:DNA-directed RNA polymerase subunit E'/Rpb7